MEILRTDGGGRQYQNERLERVRETLSHCPIESIGLIHDHKGDLNVYWLEEPTELSIKIVDLVWEREFECNSEHYLLIPKKIQKS